MSYVQVLPKPSSRSVPASNLVVKQEGVNIKEENEYIEYIDEEYLDPVYLNDGINNSGNMPIDGEDEYDEDDEYVDDDEDEEFVVAKTESGGTLVKRERIVFKNENDDDQKGVSSCAYCPKSFSGASECNDNVKFYLFEI